MTIAACVSQYYCIYKPTIRIRGVLAVRAERHVSVGVDRIQRNFGPMQKQVETWQETELSNVSAKMIVYEAFIEAELDVPRHLARRVHEFYFNPQYEDFKPRTLWSLSNAFTSAFKDLEPIPQFKATAKLSGFLEQRYSRAF
jgi:hypothetical protein